MPERKICRTKIDVHAHAFRTDFADTRLIGLPSPERLKRVWASAGIAHAVLLPLIEPVHRSFFCPTEHVMEISRGDPGAFSFAMALDPRMLSDGARSDFTPIIEYYLSKGAVGVGELQACLPIDDPKCDNLFAQLEKYGLPVTLHMSPRDDSGYGIADSPGLPGLERALKKFPGLVFIGHSQAFWAHISKDADVESMKCYQSGRVTPGRIWELLGRYPNLYCDLSAGSGLNALTRDPEAGLEFLNRYSNRLMFGCDMGDASSPPPIAGWLDGHYLDGSIGEKAYMNFCRETALRVFTRMRVEC